MQTKTIRYFDGEQPLLGELFFNESKPSQAAIMLFPAFEGRSPFALDYAKKLAAQGFTTLAVDMYGDAKTAQSIEGCFELLNPFLQDRLLVRRRALLAYQALCQQAPVQLLNIGAIGFCFGGMCVLELARSGENLAAGISVHGVLAKSDLASQAIKAKLLILHGYEDPQVPPSQLTTFAEEMSLAQVKDWTFTFFGQAKHSFTDPLTGHLEPAREAQMGREYHPIAAERTFRYALDFFKENL